MDTFDESGDKVAYTQMAGFIVGAGGFGGKRDSPKMIPTVDRPKRNPDFSIKEKVHHNQVSSSLKSYQKRIKESRHQQNCGGTTPQLWMIITTRKYASQVSGHRLQVIKLLYKWFEVTGWTVLL